MPASEFEQHLSPMAGAQVAGMIAGMYGGIQANPDAFQPGFVPEASTIESRFDLQLTSLADWIHTHLSRFKS